MIDNIFINKFEKESYLVYTLFNVLSNHDAQVLSLSNIILPDDINFILIGKLVNTRSMNSKLA